MIQPWEAQLSALRDAGVVLVIRVDIVGFTVEALDAGNAFAYILQDVTCQSFPEVIETVNREWTRYTDMRKDAA